MLIFLVLFTKESDSDSEILAPTNRGHKLKQNAKFVREGKLGPPTGPAVYKQVVEHAGYRRAIINRNPPLIDEDGYDIDSDDDDDRVQDAVTAAAEANPYATIHLERRCISVRVSHCYGRKLTWHRSSRATDVRNRPPKSSHIVPTIHIYGPD